MKKKCVLSHFLVFSSSFLSSLSSSSFLQSVSSSLLLLSSFVFFSRFLKKKILGFLSREK